MLSKFDLKRIGDFTGQELAVFGSPRKALGQLIKQENMPVLIGGAVAQRIRELTQFRVKELNDNDLRSLHLTVRDAILVLFLESARLDESQKLALKLAANRCAQVAVEDAIGLESLSAVSA